MKAKIKKTGEIVDIISYYVDRSPLDWVSYIDSKGREHYRESCNCCIDFEFVEQSNSDSNSDEHWQYVKEYAAIAAMQGVMSFFGSLDYNKETIAELAVKQADALVAELKSNPISKV